jgi:hypothetical protein
MDRIISVIEASDSIGQTTARQYCQSSYGGNERVSVSLVEVVVYWAVAGIWNGLAGCSWLRGPALLIKPPGASIIAHPHPINKEVKSNRLAFFWPMGIIFARANSG